GGGHEGHHHHERGKRLLHHAAPLRRILPVSHVRQPPTPAGSHAPADQSAKPRSNSLTEVLARVRASTCLTITAQYSECEPSLAGNCPDTTTLPGGTTP